MARRSTLFRYSGFTVMTLVGVFGGLFAAGYAFADLPLGTALGSTLPWLVLAVALSVFAVLSRRVAPVALVLLSVAVVGLGVANAAAGLVNRDDGPFAAVAVLVLATAIGFLGLRRSSLAGVLLVVLGLGQLVATVVERGEEIARGDGPGLAQLLTTSSGAVVVPVLLAGALFLVAGSLDHESPRPWGRPSHRPA